PPVAAVISATGLSGKAVEDDTVQSNAFFNAPGTPNAYSGITKKTPSASDNNFMNASTVSGISLLSLNAGISARPLSIVNSTCSGAKPATTFKIAVAEELVRRLPEIPRIFIFLFIICTKLMQNHLRNCNTGAIWKFVTLNLLR